MPPACDSGRESWVEPGAMSGGHIFDSQVSFHERERVVFWLMAWCGIDYFDEYISVEGAHVSDYLLISKRSLSSLSFSLSISIVFTRHFCFDYPLFDIHAQKHPWGGLALNTRSPFSQTHALSIESNISIY